MRIEIVAIGNELLGGFTVNTNAAYISQELLQAGYRVLRHTVLPDHEVPLRNGMREALARNDLVICTGGLGPTCDDITREIAADLFESAFRYDQELAAVLKKRYGNVAALDNQAMVPIKASMIKNLLGTAPGLIFRTEQAMLILLPGVPVEMRGMMSDVLAYLKAVAPGSKQSFCKRLHFFGLSEAIVDPFLRHLQLKYPLVELGIYPSQGMLSVNLTFEACNEAEAMSQLDLPYNEIAERFSSNRFESEQGKIEEAVHHKFIRAGLTLSAAESCTGGAFSARLTSLPGSSQYFLGSLVTYSNSLKERLLGVSNSVLQEKGAVSQEAVIAMWHGVLDLTGSDYAVAASGIAGPSGGTLEKPVGTIWCAAGRRGSEPTVWQLKLLGNREMIIERTVNSLLSALLTVH